MLPTTAVRLIGLLFAVCVLDGGEGGTGPRMLSDVAPGERNDRPRAPAGTERTSVAVVSEILEAVIAVPANLPRPIPLAASGQPVITSPPAHGRLLGEGPVRSYLAERGFVGEDRFSYRRDDGHTATVRLMVLDGLRAYARVHFQPAGSAIARGHQGDLGEAFGRRGTRFFYGWKGGVAAEWTAPDAAAGEARLVGGRHLSPLTSWEIAVPDQQDYVVWVGCGDLAAGVNQVEIEGQPVVVRGQGDARYAEGLARVTVSDGRLTLRGRERGLALCFIEVVRVESMVPALQP